MKSIFIICSWQKQQTEFSGLKINQMKHFGRSNISSGKSCNIWLKRGFWISVTTNPFPCYITTFVFCSLVCLGSLVAYGDVCSLICYTLWQPILQGAQRLSGRVLDSRPRGCRLEPHRRHCFVSLSNNIYPSLVLAKPRKTHPCITERLLMGRK